MPDIHIPLTKGQHEEIDARLLPDGLLTEAVNVRIRREGRIERRRAYLLNAAAFAATSDPRVSWNDGLQAVTIVPGQTIARRSLTATPVVGASPRYGTYYAPMGGVSRQHITQSALHYGSSDVSIDALGRLWVVEAFNGPTPETTVRCYDADSRSLLFSNSVPTTASFVHLVRCGAYMALVYSDGTSLHVIERLYAADFSCTNTTLLEGAAGSAWNSYYDVCEYSSSAYLLMSQVNATVGTMCVYNVEPSPSGSVVTTKSTVATTYNASSVQCGIAATLLYDLISVAWRVNVTGGTVGNVYHATFAYSTGALVSGPTLVYTTTGGGGLASIGQPFCGIGPGGVPLVGFNIHGTAADGSALDGCKVWSTSSVCLAVGGENIQCKPRNIGSYCVVWTSSPFPALTAYSMYSFRPSAAAQSQQRDAVACLYQCRPGASIPSQIVTRDVSGQTEIIVALPTYLTSSLTSVDLVRVITGAYADVGRPVSLNGQTIVPGGLVREWNGSALVESGLAEGPRQVVAAETGTGGIPVGTRQYSVVWEWRDESGRRHQSPPAAPVSITTVSSAKAISVTFDAPVSTSKQSGLSAAIYRTMAGASTFYLVESMPIASQGVPARWTYNDDMTDVVLGAHAILYTEGGVLAHDPPPPARYAWASGSRVLLGGLEDPSAVQWSKIVVDGEPVQWADSPEFRGNVDSAVTAVFAIDGTWVVCTRYSVWEFVGDGPSDTGAGTFSEPRKRPSATGCISQRSVVETPSGVMFQGTNGSFWLMPRGGNAPEWIGQAVRDETAAYPTVTSAQYMADENCIYWTLVGGLGGTILVYDIRNGEWYQDTTERASQTLTHIGDALVIDGAVDQQSTYSDTDTWFTGTPQAYTSTITTGDMRPFGASGWGRCRMVHLLGAETAEGGALSAFVSYDSGLSWTDTKAWTGLAVGELDLQLGPSLARGCNYRFRLTFAGGETLSALSLDVVKSAAIRRVSAAQRG
jgi:hypothetical protein